MKFLRYLLIMIFATTLYGAQDTDTVATDRDGFQNGSTVTLNSKPIELSGNRTALRFQINIPKYATIDSSFVTLRSFAANQSAAASYTISAHAHDDAPALATTSNNISSRAKTTATASWTPQTWATNGGTYNTADISDVIQEIVNRPGWVANKYIVIIIEGSGSRIFSSRDNSGTNAPKITINYTSNASELQITKTVNDPTPKAGDTLTYILTGKNNGPVSTKMTITDVLPDSLTFVSAGSSQSNFSCNHNNGTVTCSGSRVFATNNTVAITLKALVTEGGDIENTANIAIDGTKIDPIATNNSASVTVTATSEVDFDITKTVDILKPIPGDIITYTIKGQNYYGQTSRMKITDTLPAGVEFVSVSDNIGSGFECSYSGGAITCSGTKRFVSGENAVVTLEARVVGSGTISNSASVISDEGVTESYPSDNTDTISFTTKTSDLKITKTADKSTPTVGDTVQFILKGTNQGPDSTTMIITDLIPSEFTITSVTEGVNNYSCSVAGQMVTCSGSNLFATNATATITVNTKLIGQGIITNTASIDSDQNIPDPDMSDNNASVTLTTTKTDISVTKTVSAPLPLVVDDTVTYTITARNNGPTASTIRVTDTLPAGLSYVSVSDNANNYTCSQASGTVTCSGTMNFATNTGVIVTLTAKVTDVGAIVNTATAVSDKGIEDPDITNNSDSVTVTAIANPPDAVDDKYTTPLDATLNGNVLANDTGLPPLKVTGNTMPSNGNLVIQSSGSFTYVPNTDYTGIDTFTYTITDVNGNSDTALVTINVNQTVYIEGVQDFVLINPPETQNMLGNYVVMGNTAECITNSNNAWTGTCQDSTAYNDNNYMAKYIDIDGDPRTWNSSSSNFVLPSTLDTEDGKGIAWVGLFWQGSAHNEYSGYPQRRAYKSGNDYNITNITADSSFDLRTSAANQILIKIDNNASYIPVTASTFYYNRLYSSRGGTYAAYADITRFVKKANLGVGKHKITVANLTANEGRESGTGNYGGWSIVVIYKDMPIYGTKIRNISIYNGYTVIPSTRTVKISNFKLPAGGKVNAQFGSFAGEGEYVYKVDRMQVSKNADMSGASSMPNALDNDNIFDAKVANIDRDTNNSNNMQNNNGIDIDNYDISTILTQYRDADPEINTIYIGLYSSNDYITPSMMAFSAELYQPKLCYDYSYKQNNQFFTEENNGTGNPRVIGKNITVGSPITVGLYVRNKEESDVIIKDLKLSITGIPTAQAIYKRQSTTLVPTNSVFPVPVSDIDAADSFNKYIPVGDIGGSEFFYLNYDLIPRQTTLDMPINVMLEYTLVIPVDNSSLYLPYTTYLAGEVPLCTEDNFAYYPNYGTFNVEDAALAGNVAWTTGRYYNLPTQTVKRPGNFVVASYRRANTLAPNDVNMRNKASTVVAVELLDVEKYHSVIASCMEANASITPRIWMTIENNTTLAPFNQTTIQNAIDNNMLSTDIISSHIPDIASAADFFGTARPNAAFRVTYNGDGNGYWLTVQNQSCPQGGGTCYKITNFDTIVDYNGGVCTQDVNGNQAGTGTIADMCNDAGTPSSVAMTGTQLAQCMECIYGSDIQFLCSRDNFAIRPESVRMALKDGNISDISNQTHIATNTTSQAGSKTFNLAAEYDYILEVNGTNYLSDINTNGYNPILEMNNTASRHVGFRWNPDPSINQALCNDTGNYYSPGELSYMGSRGTFGVTVPQTGEYLLEYIDQNWTSVDWDNPKTVHHVGSYFLTGDDCVVNNTIVPTLGATTGISGQNLVNVSGCLISSTHTKTGSLGYQSFDTRTYPYAINVSGLQTILGPPTRNNGQNFVYIDTPTINLAEDFNMSYNLIGRYFAAGAKTGLQLSNFVTGCYADNLNMRLRYAYTHAEPVDSPFLAYKLREYNTTDTSLQYLPTNGNGFQIATHTNNALPFDIAQGSQFFARDMRGAVSMKIGYNFNRTNDLPLNPRTIWMQDFNISYDTQPTQIMVDQDNNHNIQGIMRIDQNVSFHYARVKPSKEFYQDILPQVQGGTATVNVPQSVEVYCDLDVVTGCIPRDVNASAVSQTSESFWWRSILHNNITDGDGRIRIQIGGIVEGAGTPSINPNLVNISSNGESNGSNVVSSGPNATFPLAVNVNLTVSPNANFTNSWLIFNPYHPTNPPQPYFRVRFIDPGGLWTGIGDTGDVVGAETNVKKTKRLDW